MLEAFLSGIQDGFVPLALLRWLGFYALMSYISDTSMKIVGYGFLFLISSFIVDIVGFWGGFDLLYSRKEFGYFLFGFSVVATIAILSLAFFNLIDWWRLKSSSKKMWLRTPTFCADSLSSDYSVRFSIPVLNSRFWVVFLILGVSLLLSLLASFWQGEFIQATLSFLLTQQNPQFGFNLLVFYFFGKFLFVIGTWFFIAIMYQSRKLSMVQLSFLKMINTAICFAVGTGLLMSLFVNYNQMG